MMGQEVATIINETQVAGTQVITWNGADVPAGNYIVRMTVGNQTNAGSIVKL
jgi:flagellar hook assembly protein FlgD